MLTAKLQVCNLQRAFNAGKRTGARGGKTVVVLKVPDIKKAIKILEASRTTRRDMKIKLRRPAATNRR